MIVMNEESSRAVDDFEQQRSFLGSLESG